MTLATPVRRLSKIVLFVTLFYLFARLLDSSKFISLDTADSFARWLHGNVNQENFDDLWFFTNVGLSLLSTVVAWYIVIKLVNKWRPGGSQ